MFIGWVTIVLSRGLGILLLSYFDFSQDFIHQVLKSHRLRSLHILLNYHHPTLNLLSSCSSYSSMHYPQSSLLSKMKYLNLHRYQHVSFKYLRTGLPLIQLSSYFYNFQPLNHVFYSLMANPLILLLMFIAYI